MTPAQLRRIRWAVRAVLALGVLASVSANVLHADPNPISQVIAAWPPLALLVTIELVSRVPVHRRALAVLRVVATATIAGIAAWVSYWHMTSVAARYGEGSVSAHLLPLSVDGLVLVASVSLVELAGRIRATSEPEAEPAVLPPSDPVPVLVEPDPPAVALPEVAAEAEPTLASDEPRPAKPRKAAGVSTPRRNPELTRRLVVAAAVDGLKPAEIAESLGLSVRRVNQLLKPVAVEK